MMGARWLTDLGPPPVAREVNIGESGELARNEDKNLRSMTDVIPLVLTNRASAVQHDECHGLMDREARHERGQRATDVAAV